MNKQINKVFTINGKAVAAAFEIDDLRYSTEDIEMIQVHVDLQIDAGQPIRVTLQNLKGDQKFTFADVDQNVCHTDYAKLMKALGGNDQKATDKDLNVFPGMAAILGCAGSLVGGMLVAEAVAV